MPKWRDKRKFSQPLSSHHYDLQNITRGVSMGRQGKVSSAHLPSNTRSEMSQIAPTCHFLPGPESGGPWEPIEVHLSMVSR